MARPPIAALSVFMLFVLIKRISESEFSCFIEYILVIVVMASKVVWHFTYFHNLRCKFDLCNLREKH